MRDNSSLKLNNNKINSNGNQNHENCYASSIRLETVLQKYEPLSKLNISISTMIEKFYDLHNEILNSKLVSLHYWLWNVRSLNDSKYNYITSLLSGRVIKNLKIPDLIILNETWLQTSGKFNVFNIQSFNHYAVTRDNNKKGGGVSIYVANKLNANVITRSVSEVLEYLIINVDISDKLHVYVLGLYRPPNGNLRNFLDLLESFIIKYDSNLIMLGDFNILEYSPKYKEFVDLFSSYGFIRSNNAITYNYNKFGNTNINEGSVLDNVLISKNTDNVTLTSLKTGYSDHNLLMGTVIFDHLISNDLIHRHQAIKHDIVGCTKELKEIFSSYEINENDINLECESIINTVKEVYDKNCIKMELKTKDGNFKLPPWADEEFVKICRSIHNIQEKIWKLLRFNLPCDALILKFNELQNIKSDMESFKSKKYYCNIIFKNSRLSWNVINDMCGRRKTSGNFTLINDGKSIVNEYEIANTLQNEFMSTVGKLSSTSNSNIVHRGPFVQNTFQFNEVDEPLIWELLSSLDSSKSPGSDEIPAVVWKSMRDEISQPLCTLVNQMFHDSIYPDIFKVAKVIPIHKKGSRTDPGNYRPISILPVVSKVFEKVIFMQLNEFFEKYNLYDEYQYGFRDGKGCNDAIVQVLHHTSNELDNGNGVILLSLDIAKAFDSLSHDILLKKLELMGVRGASNDLINNYLSCRQQYVKINSSRSDLNLVCKGIAQGSLCGPPMFNIMLIDMKHIKSDARIIKYADDAMVIFKVTNDCDKSMMSNSYRMHVLLNELFDYYSQNNFVINRDKSFFMCLGKSEMEDVESMLYSAGFKNETNLTYLGIRIDDKLKMNFHVDAIVTKISQANGALYHMKDKLPVSALMKFYFGHVHSHLMFCSFVLNRCSSADIKRLQTLQNRALKLVFRLPLLTPTVEIFKSFATNVLTVKGIIFFSSIIMVKKNLFNNSPDRLPMERLRSSRHFLLKCHKFNSQVMKNDICCIGIELFNNLPSNIKEINQLGQFKSAVRAFLLDHSEDLLENNNFLRNDH